MARAGLSLRSPFLPSLGPCSAQCRGHGGWLDSLTVAPVAAFDGCRLLLALLGLELCGFWLAGIELAAFERCELKMTLAFQT